MVTVGGGTVFKGAGAFSGQGFSVVFDRPSPGPYEALRDDAVAIRGASVEAVVKTTLEVKERIRDYIDAHFRGSQFQSNNRRKVANASAQSKFYDEIEAKGQIAGLVYSKFGKRDAGGFVDFLLLHVRGGTVKPRQGGWLRIENKAVANQAGRQSGFFAMSNASIFFVEAADGKKLFQFRRFKKSSGKPGRTELLATLLRQVVFPARLTGIDEIARSRTELFEGYFAQALAVRRGNGAGAV